MRNILVAILVATFNLLTYPLQASERVSPEDQYFKPTMEAVGTEREDGSLLIMVTISQRAIIHEKGESFEHTYTAYFRDHVFQDGDLCIVGADKQTKCLTISFLLSQEPKAESMGKAVKQYFVEMYKNQIQPTVESILRQQTPEKPKRRSLPQTRG